MTKAIRTLALVGLGALALGLAGCAGHHGSHSESATCDCGGYNRECKCEAGACACEDGAACSHVRE